MNEIANKIGCASGVLASLLLVFLCSYGLIMGYEVSKNIGSWLERAQVSADAEDMAIYVDKALLGLKKYDLNDGYCAIIFKKPDNNLNLHFQAITQIARRARQLSSLDKTSDAYQSGIDDLRGTLREIIRPGFMCMMAGSYIWVAVLWWIDLVLWLIVMVIVLYDPL